MTRRCSLFKPVFAVAGCQQDLSKYVKSDGTIVGETWKFEIQNLTTRKKLQDCLFSRSYVRNGVKISGLTVNIYEIKEVSGPPQNQTLYNHNTTSYTFKINTAGELVDADGAKFKAQSIYFPNERKDVDGSVVITKQDAEGNTLEGATFSLAKLNKATSTFELVDGGTKVSDATGKVQWDQLSSGSYEIREVSAPSGYIKTTTRYRFVVEDFAALSMLNNSNYVHREGGLTHTFNFTPSTRRSI